jgi:hypothetical protein
MELLKPVIDGITLVVNKASDIINSFSGEAENATDTAYKNIMAQSKASITELNKVKEATFKLQATDKDGIKQAKEKLDTMKAQSLAIAKQITDTKARARQEAFINQIYNDGIKRINELSKATKDVKPPAIIDPEAVKKSKETSLELEKIRQIRLANEITDERKKALRLLEINRDYELQKAQSEKKSQGELLLIKEKFIDDEAKINKEFNVKDFEDRKKSLETDAKLYEDNLKLELDLLKSFIDDGIANEQQLTDFKNKSLELRNIEQKKQLTELLKNDKTFNEEQKRILNNVSIGKINIDDAVIELQKFGDLRIDELSKTNEYVKTLMTSFNKKNADYEIQLEREKQIKLQEIKINAIEDRAEREKELSILNAKKVLDEELELAGDNNDKKLQADLKYIDAVDKANSDYANKNKSFLGKLLSSSIGTFAQMANNAKAVFKSITSEKIADPQVLKTLSTAESELQQQREDGLISYEEYVSRYEELEKQRADATANSTKLQIDWLKTLGTVMTDTFRQVADTFAQTNRDLTQKFTDNLSKIETAKKEFGENSKEVKALTDENNQAMSESYMNVGAVVGATFVQMIADGKSATKAFVLTALAGLKSIVPIFIAEIYAKEIASKSFAGLVTAPLLVAAITGLLSVAESGLSQLNFANGGYYQAGNFPTGMINKHVQVANVGETGRAEFVFNPQTTALTSPNVLNEINNRKISVEQWSAENYGASMDRIDKRLMSIERTLRTVKLSEHNSNYHINATNNVIQAVTTAGFGRS